LESLPLVYSAIGERKAALSGFGKLIRAFSTVFFWAKPLFLYQAEDAGSDQTLIDAKRGEQINQSLQSNRSAVRLD
jgi:hypothetical protein